MRFHGNKLPYHVVSGPSTRRLIDYAQPDHQFSVLPTGNSGNFRSENYADQCGLFMNGKHREIVLTDEQIAAQKKHALHFLPMMETIYLNK
jgi:penicillin amidase